MGFRNCRYSNPNHLGRKRTDYESRLFSCIAVAFFKRILYPRKEISTGRRQVYCAPTSFHANLRETMKKALVTGIAGQDGSYLAELLLEKNYEVHGVIRRSSSLNTGRIDHIIDRLHLHYGDMTDAASITNIVREERQKKFLILPANQPAKFLF